MINLSQWRVSIGLWHCHISPSPTKLVRISTTVPTQQVDQSNSLNDTRNITQIEQSPIELQDTSTSLTKTIEIEPVRGGGSPGNERGLMKLYFVSVLLVVFTSLDVRRCGKKSRP